MKFSNDQIEFLKRMSASVRDGAVLRKIIVDFVNELRDITKYRNLSGSEYEVETKSSLKAADILEKELLSKLSSKKEEKEEEDKNLGNVL